MTDLYRHYSKDGQLLYIGISLSAAHRLGQHKEHSHWYSRIARVEIERFESRQQALTAEREAIAKERPAHNIHHRAQIKVEKAAAIKPTPAEASARQLERQILKFDVYYTIKELPVPLRRGQIMQYMDEGRLGYFELPNSIGTKMNRYVSGWQLIEFTEWLQTRQSPTTRDCP